MKAWARRSTFVLGRSPVPNCEGPEAPGGCGLPHLQNQEMWGTSILLLCYLAHIAHRAAAGAGGHGGIGLQSL